MTASTATFYLRLGGAQGVAELVEDILDRHASNPLLALHFRCRDLAQVKARCLPLLSAASGGANQDCTGGNHLAAAGIELSERELAEAASDVVLAMQERGLEAAEVLEALQRFGLDERNHGDL